MTATTPTLTVADVTVTTDAAGRLYAVIPNTVARLLAIAAREGINPNARGIDFQSVAHPANSWAATTVRTIFEAILAARPDEANNVCSGLGLYRRYGGGTFYGFICGEGAWDADARWWRDYDNTHDLRIRGTATIAASDRGHLAGTCAF
ncbi:hypothetical protein ACIQU6_27970 [Streptomyces sp. NPDC090442]|uniref:hypothetical protein n=1 Tax=Streptomyces sp. NPDC090442 TaxID=3365962 RepID=UPI00382693C6